MRVHVEFSGNLPPWVPPIVGSAVTAGSVWSAALLGAVPEDTALHLAIITVPGSLLTQTLATRARRPRRKRNGQSGERR